MSNPKFDLGEYVGNFVSQIAKDHVVDKFVSRKSSKVTERNHVVQVLERKAQSGDALTAADLAFHYAAILQPSDVQRFYDAAFAQARAAGDLKKAYKLAKLKQDVNAAVGICGDLSGKSIDEICEVIGFDDAFEFIKRKDSSAARGLQERELRLRARNDLVLAVQLARQMNPSGDIPAIVETYFSRHYLEPFWFTQHNPMPVLDQILRAGVREEASDYFNRSERWLDAFELVRADKDRAEEAKLYARKIIDRAGSEEDLRFGLANPIARQVLSAAPFSDEEKRVLKGEMQQKYFAFYDEKGHLNEAVYALFDMDREQEVPAYVAKSLTRGDVTEHAFRDLCKQWGLFDLLVDKGIVVELSVRGNDLTSAYTFAKKISADCAEQTYLRCLRIVEERLDFKTAEKLARAASDSTRAEFYKLVQRSI